MKKLIFLFLTLLTTITTIAQQSHSVQTCGSFRKPINPSNNPDYLPLYFDRFGNEYEEDELLISNLNNVEQFECTSGYFRLHFNNNFDDKDKAVFCKVFADFSKLIPAKDPSNLIDILITIGVDDSSPQNPGANDDYTDPLMHATPIYSASCGTQAPIIANMIMTGKPNNQPKIMYVGTIAVNKWYLDQGKFYKDDLDNLNPSVPNNKFDMYYIATHEAMHILGVASLIGSNGKPIQGDGYSPWDKMLFSKKKNTKIITPITPSKDDLCCSRFVISDVLKGTDDIDDCTDEIFFRTKLGKNIAPVSDNSSPPNPPSYSIGTLSHLLENCNGLTGPFVMRSVAKIGERTLLSSTEKEILCELGYQVYTLGSCKSKGECYVVADDDKIDIVNKSGTPFTVLFTDILKNDINVSGNPTLGDIPSNVTVKVLANGFEITTSVPGFYKIPYKVIGCDGKCDYAYIYFLTIHPDLGTNCNPSNPCELLCYGNFENFATGSLHNFYKQMVNQLDYYEIKTYGDNSPDVIKNTTINNNFIQMHRISNTYESIYLQLRKPIQPDCEAFISFDGASIQDFSTVRFFAYQNNLCTGKISNNKLDFPQSLVCNNTIEKLCKSEDFYCIGESNLLQWDFEWIANPSNKPKTDLAIKFPNTSHQIIKWTNNTGKPIDKILVWIDNKTFDKFECVFDNFSVISSCDDNTFAVSSKTIAPFQLGQTAKIEYTIQASTPKSGIKTSNLELNASIAPTNNGIIIKPNAFFSATGNASLTINSGETKMITLELEVNNAATLPYLGNVFLTAQKVTNGCIAPNSPVNQTLIEINNNFTYKILDYCNNTVQFYANNSSGNHLWNFGNGMTSTVQNPIHTYGFSTKPVYNVTHQINGQPQNPTPIIVNLNPSYSISSNITGQNIFGNPNTKNVSIAIKNSLVLDLDITFDNCVFIASPGVKIEIPQSNIVKFNNCQFYSCDQMWQGIENHGDMIMTNCPIVEDAHYAIKLFDNSKATITGNIFKNNFISIFSENANLNTFIVDRNQHIGGTLKALYQGQVLYPNQKSTYAAYWLDNVTDVSNGIVSIGNIIPSPTAKEVIHDMTNGIMAHNTSLSVQNFNIYNITAGINNEGYGIFSDSDLPQGHLLFVNGNDKKVTSFDNCRAAIFDINGRVNIRNNKINNVEVGVRSDFSFGGMINDNVIAGQSGIGIGNAITHHIYDNEISSFNNTKNAGAFGILLYQTGSTRLESTLVEKNKIKTTQSLYGIALTQCNNIMVHNNKDIEIQKNSSLGFTDAIHSDNSNFCYFTHNNVIGSDLADAKSGANAIFMQNANDNTFCCNTLDKTFTGIEARDVNQIESHLYTTSFGNHTTGLWLNGVGAIIGQQDHTGNMWNGKMSVGARNDNNDFNSIIMNQFNVDNSSNPNLFPKVIQTPNAPNADWFQPQKGITILCNAKPEEACFQQKPGGLNHLDSLILEADAIELSDYTKWQLTYHLYAKLSNDPSLIANNEAMSIFYEQTKNTPIATLVGIAEGIDYVRAYRTDAQVSNDVKIKEKEAALLALQDKINTSEPDANLSKEYNNILKNIVILSNNNDLVAANTEKVTMLQELLKRNESINTDVLFEENHKNVNSIIIQQLLSKDKKLTSEYIKILEGIANQCDKLGGNAVQKARAMLTWFDNQKYVFKREHGCVKGIASKTQKNSTEVKLYPNPSNGNLIFDSGKITNTQITIYDMGGKIVLSQNISNKLTPINISYLNNGLYYCRVLGEENVIKFTIIY